MKRLALVVILLAGCASPQDSQQAVDEYWAKLRRACENYGFTPGTPEFAQCVQTERNTRSAAAAQQSAIRKQAILQMGTPR